jgi:Protein of unknown function (DUF1697)
LAAWVRLDLSGVRAAAVDRLPSSHGALILCRHARDRPATPPCLRGINLGSHKRVRMADLRELAEDLGCADVRTYVQSGNVVFRSDRSAADLTKAIEKGIEKQLGLDVIVVIRTERQLRNLVANNPFVRAKIRPNTLYVAFFAREAGSEAAAATGRPRLRPRTVGDGRRRH